MKKIGFLFLVIMLLTISKHVYALDKIDIDIDASHGILYDVTDNLTLFDKKSNDRIKIASMTKIMTAIVAIENIDNLDDKVIITDNDYKNVYQENLTVVGFSIGEEVTYRDLLYGLIFKSGADAAYALADNVSKDEKEFVSLMNQKAKELGLKNSYFTNCVGYDEDNNYSSVYDTMMFFKYALENDTFKQIISTDTYTTTNNKFTLQNVIDEQIDKVGIESNYSDYILGGKTGYTKEARNCLASYAVYGDTTYIVVLADSSTYHPIKDTVNLYETVFKNYSRKKVVNVDDYLVSLSYKTDSVKVYSEEEVDLLLPNDVSASDIAINYDGNNITNSLKKDEKLGIINLEYDGEVLKTIDVVFNKHLQKAINYQIVNADTKRFSGKSIIWIIFSSVGGFILLFALIIFISMYVDVKKNKRRWKF